MRTDRDVRIVKMHVPSMLVVSMQPAASSMLTAISSGQSLAAESMIQ